MTSIATLSNIPLRHFLKTLKFYTFNISWILAKHLITLICKRIMKGLGVASGSRPLHAP